MVMADLGSVLSTLLKMKGCLGAFRILVLNAKLNQLHQKSQSNDEWQCFERYISKASFGLAVKASEVQLGGGNGTNLTVMLFGSTNQCSEIASPPHCSAEN
ncbi:hypothetical protein GOBAR_AA23175 [Gossypium barbadense]|uniref:Uncharacterized protein n=1 Tax=Gossypium barbadense TaxID=3634 RepID=A0A2P5X2C4_GOSBA|nr:hypothetical protein GOBAR_AA23174 [Gossypium barbadense]PPR97487.1 hypothetical protein GOBAR_AA23175 [Gossypium barbadense]